MCVSLDLESIFKKWINKYQQVIHVYSSWFVPILLTAKWTDRCSVKVKRSPGGEVFGIISHLWTPGSGTWQAMSGGVFGATGTGIGSVWTIIAHRVCVQDVGSLVTAGHRALRRYQIKKVNIIVLLKHFYLWFWP